MKRKYTSPTPFLYIIKKELVGYRYEGGDKIEVYKKLWQSCPYNENIRLAKEECYHCKYNMRQSLDPVYPAWTIVCKRFNEDVKKGIKQFKNENYDEGID